jgi:hypothetical protein
MFKTATSPDNDIAMNHALKHQHSDAKTPMKEPKKWVVYVCAVLFVLALSVVACYASITEALPPQ